MSELCGMPDDATHLKSVQVRPLLLTCPACGKRFELADQGVIEVPRGGGGPQYPPVARICRMWCVVSRHRADLLAGGAAVPGEDDQVRRAAQDKDGAVGREPEHSNALWLRDGHRCSVRAAERRAIFDQACPPSVRRNRRQVPSRQASDRDPLAGQRTDPRGRRAGRIEPVASLLPVARDPAACAAIHHRPALVAHHEQQRRAREADLRQAAYGKISDLPPRQSHARIISPDLISRILIAADGVRRAQGEQCSRA
jgi:hypothetical protein